MTTNDSVSFVVTGTANATVALVVMKGIEPARRFVGISALGLWLGGFAFYTAFVLPIGHRQLTDRQFGFVTAEVTVILQHLSAVAIVVAAANLAFDWGGLSRGLRWTSVALLALLAILWAGSLAAHASLDRLLDVPAHRVTDRTAFEPLHERYEMVASVQWMIGMAYVLILLQAWRRKDRAP